MEGLSCDLETQFLVVLLHFWLPLNAVHAYSLQLVFPVVLLGTGVLDYVDIQGPATEIFYSI